MMKDKILVFVVTALFIGVVAVWAIPDLFFAAPQPTGLHQAIEKLEIVLEEWQTAEAFAWRMVYDALESYWVANCPARGLFDDDEGCWHIAELDGEARGIPFEVWRCLSKVPVDDGGGTTWEFRSESGEYGTLSIGPGLRE